MGGGIRGNANGVARIDLKMGGGNKLKRKWVTYEYVLT